MQTKQRLVTLGCRSALGLVLALMMSGCGGGGNGHSVFGNPAEDDLGDLFVFDMNFENRAGIFRDQRPEFNFNGPLAVDSIKSSTIRIWVDGDQDAITNPPCNPLDGDEPDEWVPGQFFVGLNQVTFVPDDFFLANTVYCVQVPSRQEAALAPGGMLPLATNVQGNTMVNRYEAFFITGPGFTFSNIIASVTPGGATSPGTIGVSVDTCVDIVHSRPINQASVDSGSVQLIELATCMQVPGTFSFPSVTTIRFCPTMPLQDATIHRVFVTEGVEDTSGIGSNGGTFFFQTAFPPPDGNAQFLELFDDAALQEPSLAELPPMAIRADWAATGGTAGGVVGRLVAAVGPLLPVGGQGNADLSIVTGTFHDLDTTNGTIDGGGPPSVGGVPSFLGDGVFQFRAITLGGAVTLEVFGEWPLEFRASSTILIEGNIDISGERGGDAITGPNQAGGIPSAVRRAGGTIGGQGAPSNGTTGVNGNNGQPQVVPLPATLGQGPGCGGDSFVHSVLGIVGSGGGGGAYFEAGFTALTVIGNNLTWRSGLGTLGQHTPSYGGLSIQQNSRLDPLYPGSGGGGGASSDDTPGGGGGNGAGSIRLVAADRITVEGAINAFGGRGGDVLPDSMMNPGTAGGGGGGSGGGINAISGNLVDFTNGTLDLSGGSAGLVPPPNYSTTCCGGGYGAVGRVVGEAPPDPVTGAPLVFFPAPGALQPTNTPNLLPTPIGLGTTIVNPPQLCRTYAMVSNFPNSLNTNALYCDRNVLIATMFFQANASVGQSRWFRVTNNGIPVGLPGEGAPVRHPNYSSANFATANVPSGGTADVLWMGAEESAPGSGLPKAGTLTPWTDVVDTLDTHELIRFRVNMTSVTIPDLGGAPPVAALIDISVNYSFNN